MKIELTIPERDVLDDLLEAAYKEKLHELHRTTMISFKQRIRRELVAIEALRSKVTGAHTAVAVQ